MKPNETARSVPAQLVYTRECKIQRASVPRDLSPDRCIANWLSFLREFNGIAGKASLLVLFLVRFSRLECISFLFKEQIVNV